MDTVIYADVLVVLNIYVTYLILSLSGIICRKKALRSRLLLSSVLSGFYSLIILVPDVSEMFIAVTKIPLSVLLVYIGFGFVNKKQFLRLNLCFYAVSFGFAGIMLCLWLFFAPRGMYFNNGIVYFNINTLTLVLLTVVCYAVLFVFQHYIRTKAPANTVYDCEVYLKDKKYNCHCFLDTGNSLKDPYDGSPVVIMTKEKFKDILPENEAVLNEKISFRFIPCSGIDGKKLLLSFKCDKIIIRGIEKAISCNAITVALAKDKIFGGAYDGILPCEIFSNNNREKEIYFEYEHQSPVFKA